MKLIIALIAVCILDGCSSMRTSQFETRAPSSVRNLEDLPLCARIKYIYSRPKVDLQQLPENFSRSAVLDSKRLWTAAKAMSSDTIDVGGCAAERTQDLISKSDSCRSISWAGPYIDESFLKTYEGLTDQDFKLFETCWENK